MGVWYCIVSFAGSGPSSKRSQIFISFRGSTGRSPWEVPIDILFIYNIYVATYDIVS